MKRLLTLLFAAVAIPAWLLADDPALSDPDNRAIREIQSRAYGSPRLSSGAPYGEAMIQLAELGASAPGTGNLQSPDYDALFALLQRYRDDLLKLGIDASDLDAQLKNLRLRADELSERLDKLKPKDGLKIHGRVYALFDDLHILGNAPLASPGIFSKAAGQGLRYQLGVAHAEMRFTATRGPLSGYAQFDVVSPGGLGYVFFGGRKVYVELRTPVALQFGDIDAKLTPLTLWRSEELQPFEPEPFKSRRQRLRDDLDLQPDRWRVQGARVSTDLVFFSVVRLELESLSAIAGNPSGGASSSPIYTNSKAQDLVERYATYMQGWRVGIPIAGVVTLSDNGLFFWDVTSTVPGLPYRAMNSLAHTVRMDTAVSIFRADFEYAMSSYTAPSLVSTTVAVPLTGTAMIYSAGIEGKAGHFKVFGRDVASTYHAAGAQGRTLDDGFQALGPFLTENSQLGAHGQVGIDDSRVPPRIPISYASRFNDRMIPPGTYVNAIGGIGPTWLHLLKYGFAENIDPYGQATPNRRGYGASGDWKILDGTITPLASYESFSHIDSVADTTGAYTDPFVMTRIRAGVNFDLNARLGWPFRLSGGYTASQMANGKKNAAGYDFFLASTLLDAGVEWDVTDQIGLVFGYRHMDANGFSNTHWLNYKSGYIWDVFGYGLAWKPMDNLRFDAVYTQWFDIAPNMPGTELEVDQALLRLTLEF